MKKDRVYPTCVLCTTIINLTEEEIEEYNEDNNTELKDYEIENIFREMEIEDFFSNIKYSSIKDEKVVILGTLGLWNGTHDIIPVICDNIEIAINKCINNMDDFKISQENGSICVEAYHHDGTNNFTIKLLNEKGINTTNGDLTNRRYHKRFKGYIF